MVSGGLFISNKDTRRCFLRCLQVSSSSSLLFSIMELNSTHLIWLHREVIDIQKLLVLTSFRSISGLSSLGVPGVPCHPQILADQLTLSQPRWADYAHQIILAPPDFQTFRRPCFYFGKRRTTHIPCDTLILYALPRG